MSVTHYHSLTALIKKEKKKKKKTAIICLLGHRSGNAWGFPCAVLDTATRDTCWSSRRRTHRARSTCPTNTGKNFDPAHAASGPEPHILFDTKGLFKCENILDFDTVALSFLFDKHCLIIE